MEALRLLRGKFKAEGKFRLMVYLAALALTVINIFVFGKYSSSGSGLMMFGIIITGALTLTVYYIADGIRSFIIIVGFLAKAARVFAELLGLLTAFAMGLGALFGILIGFAGVFFVVVGGIVFAYLFPIVFVPVLGFISSRLLPDDGCERDYRRRMKNFNGKKVKWDSVYEKVMAEAKEQ